MTSKTVRYPENVMDILRLRSGLTANDTSQDSVLQASTPQYAAQEMAGWYLGAGEWYFIFEKWIKDCGGRIVWDAFDQEGAPYNLEVAPNDYRYDEDMDDDVPFSHRD